MAYGYGIPERIWGIPQTKECTSMIITHAFKSDSGSNFKGNCRKELTRVYENLPPADLCFMCQKTPEKVQ